MDHLQCPQSILTAVLVPDALNLRAAASPRSGVITKSKVSWQQQLCTQKIRYLPSLYLLVRLVAIFIVMVYFATGLALDAYYQQQQTVN